MQTVRVLIADGDFFARTGIRSLLERLDGFEVFCEASTMEEALEGMSHKPDLVVLDTCASLGESLGFISFIRRTQANCRVLALSTDDDENRLYRVFEAGADGYLCRHETEDELYRAIKQIMRGQAYICSGCVRTVLGGFLKARRESSSLPGMDTLTPREAEITRMTAEGMTNKEIAEQLFISVKTVEKHKSGILHKLNLQSSAELRLLWRFGIN